MALFAVGAELAMGVTNSSDELRFSEDLGGLSIAFRGVDNKDHIWRLQRSAFGPSVKFLLRTLQGGQDRGYELELSGVRFGSAESRRHLFLFQRIKKQWIVRLRTDIWGRIAGDELTSNDIGLDALAQGGGQTNAFTFNTTGDRIAAGLANAFADTITSVGLVTLRLETCGVWHFEKRRGGQFRVWPGEFLVESLEAAWCRDADHIECDKRNIAEPTAAPNSTAGQTESDVAPVLCAAAKISGSVVLLASARSFNLNLQLNPNAPKFFQLTRNCWTEQSPDLARVSISGGWILQALAGRSIRFGDVSFTAASLSSVFRANRAVSNFSAEFSGLASLAQGPVESPIGRLVATGWPDNSGPSELTVGTTRIGFDIERRSTGTFQSTVSTIELPLLLQESELAPAESEWSRFGFNSTRIIALYCSDQTTARKMLREKSSYVWLGDSAQLEGESISRIDLSRARLEVSRTQDLAHLAFMFSDMALHCGYDGHVVMRSGSYSCKRINRATASGGDNIEVTDSRPILIVELPPQHFFEEALFIPSRFELPDVELKKDKFTIEQSSLNSSPDPNGGGISQEVVEFPTNADTLLRQIASRPLKERQTIRRALQAEKQSAEKATPAPHPFDEFCKNVEAAGKDPATKLLSPPEDDQWIYVGPYGMDPDVAAVARSCAAKAYRSFLDTSIAGTFNRAHDRVKTLLDSDSSPGTDRNLIQRLKDIFASLTGLDKPNTQALRAHPLEIEVALGKVMPDYDDFRSFYRDKMTELSLGFTEGVVDSSLSESDKKNAQTAALKLRPTDLTAFEIEYFIEENRSSLPEKSAERAAREDLVRAAYIRTLSGSDPIKPATAARLSGPTRLAFRINCSAIGQKRTVETGDDKMRLSAKVRSEKRATELRRAGEIDFSLAALMDWRLHELSVGPRARSTLEFTQSGEQQSLDDYTLASVNSRAQSEQPPAQSGVESSNAQTHQEFSSDAARLRLLGFRGGRAVTAQERIADIEASLRAPPAPTETAIELPSRLILSPSERAVWIVSPAPKQPYAPSASTSRKNQALKRASQLEMYSASIPVWRTTLDRVEVAAVRVVYSPDFRPAALRLGLQLRVSASASADARGTFRTFAPASPPRGPRAPWILGVEDGDPSASPLRAVIEQSVGKGKTQGVDDDDLCKRQWIAGGSTQQQALIVYLCEREAARKAYGEAEIFRSSLDAYDRHELVLLSSAWGVPVRGKRQQNGEVVPVSSSSQVEPPAGFGVVDLEAGSALYVPRPLRVQELQLTALGGTLRHDTDFVPPTAARHIAYGELYDCPSVERWQHWCVLGRDVFAEVIYKGYLFPLGHHASLVKQTERIFARPAYLTLSGERHVGRVRAYLRQRMFIRVGDPDKSYPCLGQPNLGRQFPASQVKILTKVTPDLVDPTLDVTTQKDSPPYAPGPGGRVLGAKRGLIFWPRTARVEGAEVHFDAMIDTAFVRLPLIFVDNTAAHDPDTVSALVRDYYNNNKSIQSPDGANGSMDPIDSRQHLRTVEFAGQQQRYCPETKPGTATYSTLAWTLKAQGLRNDAGALSSSSFEGDNSLFDSPSLEAADQPPFYPAVETGRLVLDKVQRLTAQPAITALARFDGVYIRDGFASSASPGNTGPTTPNSTEVYLNVLNAVPFTMGTSGDRSGALFNPASLIVGLSRSHGPIFGNTPQTGSDLTSIASTYADGGDPYNAFFASANNLAGAADKILNTKLLGILPLSELLKLMDLPSPVEGLPKLKEVISYGLGQAAQTVDALKSALLTPLAAAAKSLQAAWQSLDKQFQERQAKGLFQPAKLLTISDVFPEVGSALNDFLAATNTSIGTNDEVVFFASLGAVYETGNRLVSSLARVAENPVERAYLIVASAIQSNLTEFKSSLESLANGAAARLLAFRNNSSAIADEFASWVLFSAATRRAYIPLTDDDQKSDEFVSWVELPLKNAMRQAAQGDPVDAVWKTFIDGLMTAPNPRVEADKVLSNVPLSLSVKPIFAALSVVGRLAADGSKSIKDTAAAAGSVIGAFIRRVPEAIPDLVGYVNKVASDTKRNWTDKLVSSDAPLGKALSATEKELDAVAAKVTSAKTSVERIKVLIGSVNQQFKIANDAVTSLTSSIPYPLPFQWSAARPLDIVGFAKSWSAITDVPAVLRNVMVIYATEIAGSTDLPLALPSPLADAGVSAAEAIVDLTNSFAAMYSAWLQTSSEAGMVAAKTLDHLSAEVTAVKASLSDASDLLATVRSVATSPAGLEGWHQYGERMRSVIDLVDRVDLGLRAVSDQIAVNINDVRIAGLTAGETAVESLFKHCAAIGSEVGTSYSGMLTKRNELYNAASDEEASALRSALLVNLSRPALGDSPVASAPQISTTNDQLAADTRSLSEGKLASASLSPAVRANFIRSFLSGWEDGNPVPAVIAKQLGGIAVESARAWLVSIVDFSSYRDQIEAEIKKLIPQKATMEYTFNAAFKADTSGSLGNVFQPGPGSGLSIRTLASIDFAEGKPHLQVTGSLGAFKIKLVGSFDGVTISFAGAEFRNENGVFHCDLHYSGYQIGQALKFLENLSSFFTPKQGSGFYLIPLQTGIGIEAGYGLNIGTISFGDIAFFNISLNAAARLPFDGTPATFVSSLSRRDAPFTISAAPYGGSGYFAIESDGHGIIGFEASFEYGGAAAFSYGPLVGQGRLMTGIFVRRSSTDVQFWATFYAGGTAAIWVFSFGASLSVRATLQDGAMVGEATFTFSFSMGLLDFDYSVNVSVKLGQWSGTAALENGLRHYPWDGPEDPLLFAALDPNATLISRKRSNRLSTKKRPADAECSRDHADTLRVDTWCQGERWSEHRRYFDFSIQPRGESAT